MYRKMQLPKVILAAGIMLTSPAWAAGNDGTAPFGLDSFSLSAKTGLGYNNNVFHAPTSPYINYAIAAQPYLVPKKQSGFFVPYEANLKVGKSVRQDVDLLGGASVEGQRYINSSLGNANEFSIKAKGGSEFTFARQGKDKDSLYVGGLAQRRHKVYLYHEDGTQRAAANRYSYTSGGIEAKYKHNTGNIDYGANAKYVDYSFDVSPASAINYSHTLIKVGANAGFPLPATTRLDVKLGHWTEDYSARHARDNTGALTANLLSYSYNDVFLTWHGHLSHSLRWFLDLSTLMRTDSFVGYNDYTRHRYGVRAEYEQDDFSAKLSLHHWTRNYPNAFAFDTNVCGVVACPSKEYSGNILKLKSEWEQANNTAIWAELDYVAQNTTDLRYKYTDAQIMGGMRWNY